MHGQRARSVVHALQHALQCALPVPAAGPPVCPPPRDDNVAARSSSRPAATSTKFSMWVLLGAATVLHAATAPLQLQLAIDDATAAFAIR